MPRPVRSSTLTAHARAVDRKWPIADVRLICLVLAAACGSGSPSPTRASSDIADTQSYGIFEWQDDGDVAYGTVRNYLPDWSECFLPLSKAPSAVLGQSYPVVAAHAKEICGTCWFTMDVSCGAGPVVSLRYNADNFSSFTEVWWFDNQGQLAAYYKRDLSATAKCPKVIYGSVKKYCNPLWGETGDLWYYAEPTCPYDGGYASKQCDVDADAADP